MPSRVGSVHVATTRRHYKGKVYEAHLLRRSYRENGKVKNQTLGNISHLPPDLIEIIRRRLAGEKFVPGQDLQIRRSLPHGHVLAVTQTMRQLGMAELLDHTGSRPRDVALALICARVVEPRSKLATTRSWGESTLSSMFAVEDATVEEVYSALDWLLERQPAIERKLARRHLGDGGMVLYDLSSSYMEGRHCPLAKIGYSRDRKKGTLQVEYGLATDQEGRPVAVEVVPGNTGDPDTVAAQVERIKKRFHLKRAILVGDRGMLTQARIEELRQAGGIEWISALRSPQIRALLDSGAIQMGLFDQRGPVEIIHPDYPGERLVVCRNPDLAQERKRKRKDLLQATEAKLKPILESVAKGRLQGAAKIGLRVGPVLNQHKVGKHFTVDITDQSLEIHRDQAKILAESELDGIYVIRTSVAPEALATAQVVRTYKQLSRVERAFRTWKGLDIQVRPIRHWSSERVKAHILLCMLAYYVRWHLERAWAPLLFRDEQPPVLDDPVAPSERSAAALRKASTQQLEDGTPVHSFPTLLRSLATVCRNQVVPNGLPEAAAFELVTQPTDLQGRALALAGVNLASA
ncbi:MAG: IS1634 family transposase [Candidatus Dormibacteria bacterium]